MLKFGQRGVDGKKELFVLEDDGRVTATVTVEGNTVLSVEYDSEQTERRYGDFTLRSIVYILRGRYPVVETEFTHDSLRAIGFIEHGGKMSASSLRINFDTCNCKGEEQ